MAQSEQPQLHENVVHASGHDLPTGFRFHPSDYEIVNHYLTNKVRNRDFTCTAIGELDLYKIDPWDLPMLAKMGEKEWYFFYQKDRKYPTGPRVNRAIEAGYWKATGELKEVHKPNEGEGVALVIGMKKTLVFYKGRAPRGDKTNWVMHEYRLEGNDTLPSPASTSSSAANTVAMEASISSKDEWVVCRVFNKTTGVKKTTAPTNQVPMVGAEIGQNQNNILDILAPVPLQLPLAVPMAMQFPILPIFAMDPMAPYYPNPDADTGMPQMMLPMEAIGGVDWLEINVTLFGNPMVAPTHMNFYHQMGMGAGAGQLDMGAAAGQMVMGEAGQMDMGAAGVDGFDVPVPESSSSSMVSQNDEQANDTEVSSMMSVAGPGCDLHHRELEMDCTCKHKY